MKKWQIVLLVGSIVVLLYLASRSSSGASVLTTVGSNAPVQPPPSTGPAIEAARGVKHF